MTSTSGMARAGGWLRACSEVVAGGLVALAVGLAVAAFLANRAGAPGPGSSSLVWHGVAAAAAVAAQLYADRRTSSDGTGAALVVLGIAAAVLAAQWLA